MVGNSKFEPQNDFLNKIIKFENNTRTISRNCRKLLKALECPNESKRQKEQSEGGGGGGGGGSRKDRTGRGRMRE